MFRVPEVIMGALAQAAGDQIPACGGGQGAIMLVSAPEFDTGETRISIIQPLIGGSGGRPGLDGTDGVDFVAGFYRNIPTETLEADMPIMIERYGLLDDGGGAGERRGGLGLDYAIRVLSPRATLTCRAMERTRFRPWGRAGGHPGRQGFARLREAGGAVRELGKIDVMQLRPGEILEIGTPCGGGFGDPLERDPVRVVADVSDGYVGAEAARELYGVVLDAAGELDAEATPRLRARLRAERPPVPDLYAGPERAAFEALWTDALQSAVHDAVWRQPAGLRSIVKEAVEAHIRERFDAGGRVAPEEVGAVAEAALAQLRRRLYA
jgi:N-methylhydantoinase B